MKRSISILLFVLFVLNTSAARPIRVLTQKMVDASNGYMMIKSPFSLMNDTIVLPKDFHLEFNGGSIRDGVIIGEESKVSVLGDKPVFGLGLQIRGSWNQEDVYDRWFEFNSDTTFIANDVINNIFALTDDKHFTHVFFDADRIYYFELPYHGRADLGETVTYHFSGNRKRRHYRDLGRNDHDYLRIFSIPSNTYVTINNTLQMLPTNMGAYFVFWEYNKENITIDGNGKIIGDAFTHIYNNEFNADSKNYYGEWGMILMFLKCRNISIKGVSVESAFGDCLTFSGSFYENDNNRWSDGLKMDSVSIRYGRRNGLVIGARNVEVKNCYFEGCGIEKIHGTQPWAAIDLEPDYIADFPELYLENVVIDNCSFGNNTIDINSYIVAPENEKREAATIKNCIFSNPISINSSYWLTFENCIINSLKSGNNSFSMFTNSKHLTFKKCVFKKIDVVRKNKSLLNDNRYINCSFNVQ